MVIETFAPVFAWFADKNTADLPVCAAHLTMSAALIAM
jgi:hypothetical protein